LISFVWTPGEPLPAGTGGSENYTIGHVRELNRRGVAAQVVTVGLGTVDGRDEFVDIPFQSLGTPEGVSDLAGTVVFVTDFPDIATRHPAYQILHVPPPLREDERRRTASATRNRGLIATSRFAARLWSTFLDVDIDTVAVVYPFAEPGFGLVERPAGDPLARRILYAGRLSPEKGIYTLLAMLHSDLIDQDVRLAFTATAAGADKPQGRIIQRLVEAHPGIQLVSARKAPHAMATLMAEHDIVVMPSNSQYWHETFGIVSIEGAYDQRSIPSFRQVIDLSPRNDSRFLDAVGESGHPLSAHYADWLEDWAAVRYKPMRMDRQAVERGAIGHLRLTPGADSTPTVHGSERK